MNFSQTEDMKQIMTSYPKQSMTSINSEYHTYERSYHRNGKEMNNTFTHM